MQPIYLTHFYESIVQRVILDLVLFIAIYHGYYGPRITFVVVVASYV